jgi:hypothetical protein
MNEVAANGSRAASLRRIVCGYIDGTAGYERRAHVRSGALSSFVNAQEAIRFAAEIHRPTAVIPSINT